MKRNIKLTIAYDGSRYNGWQKQGNTTKTIQGTLEGIICTMTQEPIELQGSGRTDAGVHAYGQVANFHTKSPMSLIQMKEKFMKMLPEDIVVCKIEEVPKQFHSRLSATKKIYQYRIFNSERVNVFQRNYVYQEKNPLDVKAMKKAAKLLIGTHDFRSFCSNKDDKKSTIRTLYAIEILKSRQEIMIRYCGNGFLYNMVRILTGTLLEVGLGRRDWNSMSSIMEEKNRNAAGFTAPSQGLSLYLVRYDTMD